MIPTEVLAQLHPHRVVGSAVLPGETNRTWRVRFDGRDAALRLRLPAPGSRLSLEREVAVMRAAGAVAPDVLFARGEVLVTAFVPARREPSPEAVGVALARLHTLREIPRIRMFRLSHWLRSAEWPSASRALEEEAHRLADRLREAPPVLCHHDLHLGNIRHDGAIRFLDWEFAARADPAVDLAAVTRDLPDAAAQALLEAYRGAGGPGRLTPELARAYALLCWHWERAAITRSRRSSRR